MTDDVDVDKLIIVVLKLYVIYRLKKISILWGTSSPRAPTGGTAPRKKVLAITYTHNTYTTHTQDAIYKCDIHDMNYLCLVYLLCLYATLP